MSDYSGTFLGKEFTITENACHLLSVRNEYALLAEQGWEHYEKTYDGYKNFQTFAKKGIREGYLLIENYFSQTVARLVSEGYYDIDKRALLQEYGYEIFADWREIEEAVIELSEAANQTIKESAELRELRKDTRARAAGIGIGAAGTIGALAVSGAYNLLSGIAHTGANAVGNAKTISQIRRQQDTLYESNEFKSAIRKSFESALDALAAMYFEYQGAQVYGFSIVKEKAQKAASIRENFRAVPPNDKPTVAHQMLKLDPCSIKSYQLILQEYQDPNRELAMIAEAVGAQHAYESAVKKCLSETINAQNEKYKQQMDNLSIDLNGWEDWNTVEEYKKSTKEFLKSIAIPYGLDTSFSLFTDYTSEVDEYFSSALNKKIDAAAYELSKSIDKESDDTLVNYIKVLSLQMQKCTDTDILGKIEKSIAKMQETLDCRDKERRTFLKILFDTADERDKAEKDYKRYRSRYYKLQLSSENLERISSDLDTDPNIVSSIKKVLKAELAETIKTAKFQEEAEQKRYKTRLSCRILELIYGFVSIIGTFLLPMFNIDGRISSVFGFKEIIIRAEGPTNDMALYAIVFLLFFIPSVLVAIHCIKIIAGWGNYGNGTIRIRKPAGYLISAILACLLIKMEGDSIGVNTIYYAFFAIVFLLRIVIADKYEKM